MLDGDNLTLEEYRELFANMQEVHSTYTPDESTPDAFVAPRGFNIKLVYEYHFSPVFVAPVVDQNCIAGCRAARVKYDYFASVRVV